MDNCFLYQIIHYPLSIIHSQNYAESIRFTRRQRAKCA